MGRGLVVKRGASFSLYAGARVTLGQGVQLAEGAKVFVGVAAKLLIEDGVFIGSRSTVVANGEVHVGKGSQIAHHVTVIDTDHRFDQVEQILVDQGGVSNAIRIEPYVWIGANAVVLKGVILGVHSVVGAGSVVTKSIAPYAVAVGNPAREISRHAPDKKPQLTS